MSGKSAKKKRREQAHAAAAANATARAAEEQREQLDPQLLAGEAARYGVTIGVIKHELFQAGEAGMALDHWMARKRARKLQEAASVQASEAARSARVEHPRETAEQRRKQRAEATHRRPRKNGERRERSIMIRVNDCEYQALSRKAYQQQLSLSAYLVQSGMNRRIRNPKRGPIPQPTFVPERADVAVMPVVGPEHSWRVETTAASGGDCRQLTLLPASWGG